MYAYQIWSIKHKKHTIKTHIGKKSLFYWILTDFFFFSFNETELVVYTEPIHAGKIILLYHLSFSRKIDQNNDSSVVKTHVVEYIKNEITSQFKSCRWSFMSKNLHVVIGINTVAVWQNMKSLSHRWFS